jgi:transposase
MAAGSNLAAMPRPITILDLTADERAELQRRVRASTTTKRDCLRAEIVLARARGLSVTQVAESLEVSVPSVCKWSSRFEAQGLDGLGDLPGRGRKSWLPTETVARIVSQVTQPPPGRTRWSVRSMAKAAGVSRHAVHTVWKRNDLKPHLTRTFKLSNDPLFEQKFWDVIGLYLNPPDEALVFCCDEKSQCQALERSQPGLPLGVGHVQTRTHDYVRHGTITLFAALNYLEGRIIARNEPRHTHVEWLRFLKQIDRQTPKELAIHLVVDNYCTHKHQKVQAWLARHPRFHMHFTPTSSSWLNLVERFFADLTADVVREGSFASVRELVGAIEAYLADHNRQPTAYRWHAKGEEILAKIQRARQALAARR